MRQTTAPLSKSEPRSCTECGSVFEKDYRRCPWDGNELVEGPGHNALLHRRLGAWRVEKFMAGGGMGRIYRAIHDNGTVGALKTLAGDLVASDQGRRRFVREAEALKRLRHDNVVSVLDCQVQTAGPPFIVMEFCEGPTLQEVLLKEGRLSCETVVEYMSALADGLGHAHENGLVHRDLKPDNVVLCPSRNGVLPKILDFGVVRLLDEHEDNITQAGHLVGTPMFMAPEQILGERVGPAADFYSLGVLAYLLVEGRPPFDGDGGQMLRHVLESEPAPTTSNVPPVLESLIHRLLDKNPRQRLHRAQDVLDLLAQCKKPRGGEEPTAAVRRRKLPAEDLNLAPVIAGATPIVIERSSTARVQESPSQPQDKLRIPFLLIAGFVLATGLLFVAAVWRSKTEVVRLETRGVVVARPLDVVEIGPETTRPELDDLTEGLTKSESNSAGLEPTKSESNSAGLEPTRSESNSAGLEPTKSEVNSAGLERAKTNMATKSGLDSTLGSPSPAAAKSNLNSAAPSKFEENSEPMPAEEATTTDIPSYQDMLREASRQLKLPSTQEDRTKFNRWRSIYLSAVLAQDKPTQRKAAEARLRTLIYELSQTR